MGSQDYGNVKTLHAVAIDWTALVLVWSTFCSHTCAMSTHSRRRCATQTDAHSVSAKTNRDWSASVSSRVGPHALVYIRVG